MRQLSLAENLPTNREQVYCRVAEVLKIAAEESFVFADVDNLGKVYVNNTYNQKHIESVLKRV